jgi:hypothetical protein
MRLKRWWVGGASAVLLCACADGPGPILFVAPDVEVERAMAPDGYEAPSYASESSVPPEHRWAEVYSHRERVSWESNTATGYGSMEYFGNRGRVTLELQVLNGYSTVGTTRTEREQPDLVPAPRIMGIPLPYTVPESCGQTANLSAVYSARTVLVIDTRLTEIGPHIVPGHAFAAQPACPDPDPGCGSPDEYMTSMSPAPAPGAKASPDGYLYDPYDPGYGSGTASDCSPGAGGSGEDSSGGSKESFPEMCSAAGGKLYYDYGCIEKYNWDKATWETIWCGTYAVCET